MLRDFRRDSRASCTSHGAGIACLYVPLYSREGAPPGPQVAIIRLLLSPTSSSGSLPLLGHATLGSVCYHRRQCGCLGRPRSSAMSLVPGAGSRIHGLCPRTGARLPFSTRDATGPRQETKVFRHGKEGSCGPLVRFDASAGLQSKRLSFQCLLSLVSDPFSLVRDIRKSEKGSETRLVFAPPAAPRTSNLIARLVRRKRRPRTRHSWRAPLRAAAFVVARGGQD